MVDAYVCLGANLGDPPRQIASAIEALAELPETVLLRTSTLYRSRPMGPADQPDYANAVVALRTMLPPLALLDALLAIEQRAGRVRQPRLRNGPRQLDLDLLLYGDLMLAEARLTVPHHGVHERDFVLVPLLEIAPDVTIPGVGRAADWLARCTRHDLEPWPVAASA